MRVWTTCYRHEASGSRNRVSIVHCPFVGQSVVRKNSLTHMRCITWYETSTVSLSTFPLSGDGSGQRKVKQHMPNPPWNPLIPCYKGHRHCDHFVYICCHNCGRKYWSKAAQGSPVCTNCGMKWIRARRGKKTIIYSVQCGDLEIIKNQKSARGNKEDGSIS